ncbi:hypothetical protein FB451DRAFT_1164982 [Mycena latifolia]|nr:hypothetical protein FB451DRAFT_1164982 [Mycena latifolia]
MVGALSLPATAPGKVKLAPVVTWRQLVPVWRQSNVCALGFTSRNVNGQYSLNTVYCTVNLRGSKAQIVGSTSKITIHLGIKRRQYASFGRRHSVPVWRQSQRDVRHRGASSTRRGRNFYCQWLKSGTRSVRGEQGDSMTATLLLTSTPLPFPGNSQEIRIHIEYNSFNLAPGQTSECSQVKRVNHHGLVSVIHSDDGLVN